MTPRAEERLRQLASGVLLIAIVVAVYAGTLAHGFIWDDDLHVYANPRVIGPEGLREIWTTAAANYFPLVLTNFWAQHALWGLNPVGYHAVTVICHALCALLLWRVLLALRVPGAWFGAALWALHPVQVESVAWISELKNTQSGIFFLLSILCFVRWLDSEADEKRKTAFYAFALASGLFALLSKPSTVMLPVALALIVWWRRRELRVRDFVPLAPFFLLSAVASGWAIWEQRVHSGASGAEWNQNLLERVAIAGKTTWFYLGKLLWPHPLAFIYPRWATTAGALDLLPSVAAAAACTSLWWRRDAWRPAFVAAVFFVALLFPVLGFFNVYFFRYSFVGDHFQYLASIGPLALIGAGMALLSRRAFTVVASALLIGCGALTCRQAEIYRDSTTLWRATVARTPAATMAWVNLGDSLSREQRFAESIAAYREAVRQRPNDAEPFNDLGCVLTLAGDPAAAVTVLERSLALQPNFAEAHNNLGNALRDLGRRADAIAQYEEAIRLTPSHASAHNNLGSELAEAGRFDEAVKHFDAALRLKPTDTKTRENLVHALYRRGKELVAAARWREAVTVFQRAVQLVPVSAPFQASLAVALVNADRLEEAVPIFETALRLDPKSAEVRDNFGQVLNALGRKREAFEQMEAAAQIRRAAPRPR